MKLKLYSLILLAIVAISCDPEYPTPTPASKHNPVTGKPVVFPTANVMAIHASPNAGAVTLSVDNVAVAGSSITFSEKFPAAGFYSNAVPAGSRQIRVVSGSTSVLSTRPFLNGGTNHSFFAIGRAGVTSGNDRLRLIESLNESLPNIPTGTPNTVHVRLLNFGLVTSPNTVGSIALRIDNSSPTAAPSIPGSLPQFTTNGTYFLASDQTFPLPAPASGQPDYRTIAKSYASTTSPFTALTVPVVGGSGNDYIVDLVTTSNGNTVLDNVNLNLVAGRVYTLALIGSNVGGDEQPYQLLVIRHR